MATNEDLLREIAATRAVLEEHIRTEEPVLTQARSLIETHGEDHAAIKARIQFVNEWMETSKDRKALRRAVIEKSTIAAIWAIIVFVAIAIQHELSIIVTGWRGK